MHLLPIKIAQLFENSLFRNSFFLMSSTVVLGGVGFLFWVVVARSFDTGTVGLATSLLAMSSLISLFGLGGFDTVFIRFLAKAKDKSKVINTGLLMSGLLSGTLALVFCLLTPLIAPDISFVAHNPLYTLAFMLTTMLTTWNTIINAAFIARRRGGLVLLTNSIFSVFKLGLPFFFAGHNPMIIFGIIGAAQVVYVTAGLSIMARRLDYRLRLRLDVPTIKDTYRYGAAAYSSNLLNLLPDSVLPILVLNFLGAHQAAYFYIAFTIANFLYTIAFVTTQASLAEASHDTGNIGRHVRSGLKLIYAIMTPSIIVLVLLAPFVLQIFGSDYRSGATQLTILFALSGFAVALYAAFNTLFKATRQLVAIVISPAVKAVSIITLAALLIPLHGLVGVGWAWLVGNVLAVTAGAFCYLQSRRKSRSAL